MRSGYGSTHRAMALLRGRFAFPNMTDLTDQDLRMLGYEVELEPGERGTVLVTCPALPEVAVWGETIADALDQVEGAISNAIALRMADTSCS